MSQALIVATSKLAWETWSPEETLTRGNVLWKNIFSRGLTDTDALTAGIAIVHSGDALYPHHREPSEIYYVLQGKGIMTLGEAEYPVQMGDAVFIPGDLRHGIANPNAEDLVFFYAFARDSFEQITYHFPDTEGGEQKT